MAQPVAHPLHAERVATTTITRRFGSIATFGALCAALAAPGCSDAGDGTQSGGGQTGATTSGTTTGTTGAGGAGVGGAGSGGAGGSSATGGGPPADPCDFPSTTTVDVSDAAGLLAALEAATPDTMIRLAAGIYAGHFEAAATGAEGQPIVVCGPREAILDGGSTGYVFHLTADHYVLSGFTVMNGQKGVMLDGADDNLLIGLSVSQIGQEAVHFRTHSRRNTLAWSEIRDAGLSSPGFGEGVYVGSAKSNWEAITGSADTPDESNDNRILHNELGPGIAAEHIDIKEGTTGGEVRGNTFHGEGISGANFADSWIDVKGNGWLIAGNVGTDSPKDGFQTHVHLDGWGNNNVFEGNVATVNGPGHGFWIDGDATGNVVRCDNQVSAADAGFANVECVD